jgi:hypothetical protein
MQQNIIRTNPGKMRESNNTGVGDGCGFVIEPALGLGGLLVGDLVGRVLIPVIGLRSTIQL